MKKKYLALLGLPFLLILGSLVKPVDAQVGTTSDTGTVVLTSATSNVLATDTQASHVAMTTTSVGMTYPVKASLFGFIPVTLTAQTQVSTNGSITVQYPWYMFLFSTNETQLETTLTAVGKVASQWDTNTLTSQQQLVLLNLLHVALQNSFEASSSASTSASS